MTDEEITKLCAEAMGLKVTEVYWAGKKEKGLELVDEYDFQFDCRLCYDPLHNDAQAMALVKMFRLAIGNDEDVWYVCPDRPFEEGVMYMTKDKTEAVTERDLLNEPAQGEPVFLPRSKLVQGPLIRQGRLLEIALAVPESEQSDQLPKQPSGGPT